MRRKFNFKGNFKIRVITDGNRWLIWDRNIGEYDFKNYVIAPEDYTNYIPSLQHSILFSDVKDKLWCSTPYTQSDKPSKVNFNEYFIIQKMVKAINKKYNKKKDILI